MSLPIDANKHKTLDLLNYPPQWLGLMTLNKQLLLQKMNRNLVAKQFYSWTKFIDLTNCNRYDTHTHFYSALKIIKIVICFQDIFLPHVESGAITLIGATTENPSFSLNSALLSRCRVIVLEKLSTDNIFDILKRSLKVYEAIILTTEEYPSFKELGYIPK